MKQFYLKLSSLTVAVLMALLLVFSSMPVLAANENPAVDIEVPGAFNNKATIYLDIGETRTITYVLKDSNGDITTDPNASVTPKIERQETDSGSGSVISPQDLNTFVVKGLAVGYASIRIDMETTENFRGTQWIDVYVANQNPESVKASTDSITLNLKTKEDYPVRNFFNGIAALGEEDESFCDLTFSVADPSIAKVSDASPYWLTPLAVGSTTLTATARNGKSATVDLKVVDENLAEDITVKGNPEGMRVADISMKFGTDTTLEYTLLPEGGDFSDEIVIWSVFAGDDVVEVDQNGKVTPKKSGSAQVKATTKLGDYAHWNITVTSDAPQAEYVMRESYEYFLAPGESVKPQYTLYDANWNPVNDPNVKVQWVIDKQQPSNVAQGTVFTLDDPVTGTITGVSAGSGILKGTFTFASGEIREFPYSVYVATPNPDAVLSSKETLKINLRDSTMVYLFDDFYGSPDRYIKRTYSIADPTVAEIVDGYYARAKSVGTTTITATAENGKSITIPLEVIDGEYASDISTIDSEGRISRILHLDLKAGSEEKLKYQLFPYAAGGGVSDEKLTWSLLRNSGVVTLLDQEGTIKINKGGVDTVKAVTVLGQEAIWVIQATEIPDQFYFDPDQIYILADKQTIRNEWFFNRLEGIEDVSDPYNSISLSSSNPDVIEFGKLGEIGSESAVIKGIGKTTITASFWSDPTIIATHEVEVINNPLSDFRVEDVTLIEGQNMVPSRDRNKNEYQRYSIYGDQKFTIVYNGTTYTGDHKFIQQKLTDDLLGYFPGFTVYDNQSSADTVIKVGETREITIELMGKSTTFNATVVPASSPATYTVTWKDYDGTVLTTETYSKGDTPEYKDTEPARAASDKSTFVFKGWTPEIEAVTADTEYTAEYTEIPITYTVTWKDYGGTVLTTETYSKGDTPEYKGSEPARDASDTSNTSIFVFKGWTPEIKAVTADAVYTAEYETIQPEVAAPVVEVTGTITDEDKQILVDSLKDAGGLGVDETTLKDAIEIDAEDLQKKILDENIDPGTVSIETKFVIEAKDVNKDSGQISLTMDITPKCVISYTKDGETKVLDEKPLTISKPVSMMVPVGSLFGTDTPDGTTIYVVHKQAIYNGTLDTEGAERYVKFDNPDGFSEFTFTTEDPAVIKIDEEGYLTLQDAVDAVEDGGKITIEKAEKEALTATVSKEISFTVNIAEGVNLTKDDISLTAGDGYEMSVSEDKYTFTKKADPEPVYIPAEADYSKVDAALKKAEELDRELYTEESLKAVDDAAAAVTRGLYDYEQAKVDEMAAAIEDALAALEEKEPEIPDDTPADYSAVNDAIAKIPADLSIYTDESVAALEAALAGIEEGLTADEQAKVDEMAAALELAIAGLEEKDQPQPEPVILEGWQLIEGGWYYFIKNVPQKGWLNTEDGWYYLDPNTGIRQYGWVYDGGFWYFLNGETGIMETGWVFDNGSWYLMDYSGRMMTGWAKVGDLWYFLKGNGAMAANEWIEGYWLGASGAWTYNAIGVWKQNSTGWWFEDTYGWYPVNTTVRIDYIDYMFNAAGYWVQ